MQPLISIIIPTYNRAHLLGETLESIILQTHENWECIVIDDGSEDYTTELMEFYIALDLRIFYFKRPVGRLKGANSCRNFGFEQSKGQYINWFDDDDLMHPQKLERQLKFLEESSFSFCVCHSVTFKERRDNLIELRSKNLSSRNPFFDFLIMKTTFMTPSVLWRRSFIATRENLFDEELQAAQEWEFHLRILNEQKEFGILLENLDFLRNHSKSVTYNKDEYQRFFSYFMARLKIYKNIKLNLDLASEKFLKEYLLNSFKKMIITKNPNTLRAFQIFIIPDKGISSYAKLNALLATFTFKFFSKGNAVLQKIKFK